MRDLSGRAVMDDRRRLELLAPSSGRKRVVVDTDTYNEIDDQFAVAYAWLSPMLDVEAYYAAPFHNARSTGPADGMEKSVAELERVLGRLDAPAGLIRPGARSWLDPARPERSPAVDDLIARAHDASPERPLFVIALGAPTNIAAALLLAPHIGQNLVVVWMGAQPSTWPEAECFNASQDVAASNVLFDGMAPLVHLPGYNVTEHLRTSLAELEAHLTGCGPLADYLLQIYRDYAPSHFARTKEIWDLGPVSWLVDASWTRSTLVPAPRIAPDGRGWLRRPEGPLMREVYRIDRDAVFADLFRLLGAH